MCSVAALSTMELSFADLAWLFAERALTAVQMVALRRGRDGVEDVR